MGTIKPVPSEFAGAKAHYCLCFANLPNLAQEELAEYIFNNVPWGDTCFVNFWLSGFLQVQQGRYNFAGYFLKFVFLPMSDFFGLVLKCRHSGWY